MISIGTKLWRFDENHRRYTRPKKGNFWGDLIWREHWRPMRVVGETRVSWLVGFEGSALPLQPDMLHKLPKAAFKDGGCPKGWALSEAHVDELVWAKENRHRLVTELERCDDPRVWRAVEELLKGKK